MTKMTTCKSCSKEIAKSAKTCPNCGAKIKGGWIKKILFAWVIIALISFIYRTADENSIASVEGMTITNDSSQYPVLVGLDKKIKLNDVQISIVDLKINESFSDPTGILDIKAQSGAVLVAVVVDFTNVGSKSVNTGSLPSTTLLSNNGIEIQDDIGKTSIYEGIRDIEPMVLADIAPGLKYQEAFVFEVSKESLNTENWMLKVGQIRNVMFSIQ